METKRANTHKSQKLDALLGQKVCVTYWDGRRRIGVLGKAEYGFRYSIDSPDGVKYVFAKSLVKKVEVSPW